jgi:hypothetical protein
MTNTPAMHEEDKRKQLDNRWIRVLVAFRMFLAEIRLLFVWKGRKDSAISMRREEGMWSFHSLFPRPIRADSEAEDMRGNYVFPFIPESNQMQPHEECHHPA